ncbi:MAG: type I 3-dehydroquinate dehydratase [Synergistetes bacterium]|nr:type I 3-dehydroquinate dehydratase [Synergistota bacterium]MCX8127590.1 type I 3-dehydroquinate dehydratase [Synergistota bacterium]MDW8191493.1 type I 3-dehydroquinate dehydratase [Synergistota bacterium]
MRLACLHPLGVRKKVLGGPRPVLCIPLVARSQEEVFKVADFIFSFGPDFIELRIDYWDFLEDVSKVIDVIFLLRKKFPDTPFILTCRDFKEGGFKDIDLDLKRKIYIKALEENLVDFIDLELALGQDYINSIKVRKGTSFLILSYHEFSEELSEDEIFAKFSQEVFCGADVAKVAIMPKSHDDLISLLNATLRARKAFPNTPIISMAMGRIGILSRIVGFAWGSDLSFAMLSEASAPGQVPASILSELFKIFENLGMWERG